jgi:CheY-like chemotaxis protein
MTPKTLLVVDDEPEIGRQLAELLKLRLNVAAECVQSGRTALDRIDRGGVDLVLSDIRMPGLDGIEICERLAAHQHRPEVLLMSAWHDVALPEVLDRGAIGLIHKPIDLNEIVAAFTPYFDPPLKRWRDRSGADSPSAKIGFSAGFADMLRDRTFQFGRAGFFLSSEARLGGDGDRVRLHLTFADGHAIEGGFRVAWSRTEKRWGFLRGAGLLVEWLSPQSLIDFAGQFAKCELRSTVPIGTDR